MRASAQKRSNMLQDQVAGSACPCLDRPLLSKYESVWMPCRDFQIPPSTSTRSTLCFFWAAIVYQIVSEFVDVSLSICIHETQLHAFLHRNPRPRGKIRIWKPAENTNTHDRQIRTSSLPIGVDRVVGSVGLVEVLTSTPR
jgi:hypothetical protein